MLGSVDRIMDDLIFHELWLSKEKFQSYENEDFNESEYDDEDVSTDDEDGRSFRRLFPKEDNGSGEDQDGKKKKKSKTIVGNNTSEWMAVLVGVFFVAAVAGVASYQAYKSDLGSELNKAYVSPHIPFNNDNPSTSQANDEISSDSLELVPEGAYNEIQLPKHLSPLSYILYLSVDILKKEYNGLVKISFKCMEETDKVILHSSRTHNNQIDVKDGKDEIKVVRTQYNRLRGMMIVSLDRNLTRDHVYSLLVSFERPLTYSTNDGFYLTRYKDGNGESQ